MRLSHRIKTLSYLKSHGSEVLDELKSGGEPFVITQNGEAQAVLQSIDAYEKSEETLALLKILVLGQREEEAGKLTSAADAFMRLLNGEKGWPVV